MEQIYAHLLRSLEHWKVAEKIWIFKDSWTLGFTQQQLRKGWSQPENMQKTQKKNN